MKSDRRLDAECALIYLASSNDDLQALHGLKLDEPILRAVITAQKVVWSIVEDVRKAYGLKPEPAEILMPARRR